MCLPRKIYREGLQNHMGHKSPFPDSILSPIVFCIKPPTRSASSSSHRSSLATYLEQQDVARAERLGSFPPTDSVEPVTEFCSGVRAPSDGAT